MSLALLNDARLLVILPVKSSEAKLNQGNTKIFSGWRSDFPLSLSLNIERLVVAGRALNISDSMSDSKLFEAPVTLSRGFNKICPILPALGTTSLSLEARIFPA